MVLHDCAIAFYTCLHRPAKAPHLFQPCIPALYRGLSLQPESECKGTECKGTKYSTTQPARQCVWVSFAANITWSSPTGNVFRVA